MGKFTDVLIISDVDGTFFGRSAESFDKNVSAVEKFKDEGGLFAFATGRDLNALLEVIPDAAKIANAPVIVTNGAQIYDFAGEKYIHDCPIKNKKLLAETVNMIYEKYPETGVRFSCENNMIIPKFNEILKRDLRDISLDTLKIIETPFDELINSDMKIYKCVIVDMPEILEEIRLLSAELDKNGELFYSKSYLYGLEAVDKNGTKGQAARRLKDYVGNAYKLFAIGDYEKDIGMLKAADFGAAPKNALEQVKLAAKIITADYNDGAVADLINIIQGF
jgi:Cof subfamily protein (haloacid dehalogenase superfamily)